jgi:DNA-binding transcriptional LysR family regulator
MPAWREDERVHDLNDLLFFAAVVEQNGFSAAARSLNLPKSSVSRHVGRLEDRLGVRLLERSTRNVRLTEIGSSYYARCKAILSELETAEQDLALLRSDPIGTIRVSCPTGLAQYALARIVPGFMADYPLVRVQIIATNRAVDLIEEKVDVAIRARTRLNDETLTMRRLGSSSFVFVASPDFVDRHPVLVDPSDITGLPFLSFQEDTARPSWTLTGPDQVTVVVAFDPILWTSEFSIVVEAACGGTGIALLPTALADRPIREGRLVRVLPGWRSEEVNLHLVFTTRRGLAPAVRVFIDYLADHFVFRDEGQRPINVGGGKSVT